MEKFNVTLLPVVVPVRMADWFVAVPQKNPCREEEVHVGMFGLSMNQPLEPVPKNAVRLDFPL